MNLRRKGRKQNDDMKLKDDELEIVEFMNQQAEARKQKPKAEARKEKPKAEARKEKPEAEARKEKPEAEARKARKGKSALLINPKWNKYYEDIVEDAVAVYGHSYQSFNKIMDDFGFKEIHPFGADAIRRKFDRMQEKIKLGVEGSKPLKGSQKNAVGGVIVSEKQGEKMGGGDRDNTVSQKKGGDSDNTVSQKKGQRKGDGDKAAPTQKDSDKAAPTKGGDSDNTVSHKKGQKKGVGDNIASPKKRYGDNNASTQKDSDKAAPPKMEGGHRDNIVSQKKGGDSDNTVSQKKGQKKGVGDNTASQKKRDGDNNAPTQKDSDKAAPHKMGGEDSVNTVSQKKGGDSDNTVSQKKKKKKGQRKGDGDKEANPSLALPVGLSAILSGLNDLSSTATAINSGIESTNSAIRELLELLKPVVALMMKPK